MFFDLLPKLFDIDAKILRVFGMRRSPDRRKNLFVSYHAAGMPRQK